MSLSNTLQVCISNCLHRNAIFTSMFHGLLKGIHQNPNTQVPPPPPKQLHLTCPISLQTLQQESSKTQAHPCFLFTPSPITF